MKKLASFKYDVLDYILAGEFSKVASLISGLSDSAKNANVPDFNESQERPNSDFALVLELPEGGQIKKFACYTPELTELSMAFLKQNLSDLPYRIQKTASARLSAAAVAFGLEVPKELSKVAGSEVIADPLVDLTKVADFSEAKKNEAAPEYAFGEEQKYPIKTPSEIIKAAEYFESYYTEMAPWKAAEFAKNTSAAAKSYDLKLKAPALQKFASLDYSKKSTDVRELILTRQSFVPQNQPEVLAKYASLAEASSSLAPDALADELINLDLSAELDSHWGARLTHPVLSTFGVKKASYSGPSLEDLRGLSDEHLTAVTGNDIITALKSDEGVDVYHTLPRPIKREVDGLLARK